MSAQTLVYENCCKLLDSSMGKVILCRDGDTIRLYGDLKQNISINGVGIVPAKTKLRNLAADTLEAKHRSIRLFGFHENINQDTRKGEIIGGAIMLIHFEKIYFAGKSYGRDCSIDIEDLKQCLPGRYVEHVELE